MEKKGLFASFEKTVGFLADFWNENIAKPVTQAYNFGIISLDSEKDKPYFELAEIKLKKKKLPDILKNLRSEFEDFGVEFNEVHQQKINKIFGNIQSEIGSEKSKIISITFTKSKNEINVFLLSAIEILPQSELNYVGHVLYIDKARYEIHRKANLKNSPNFLEGLNLEKFERVFVIDLDNQQME